MQKINLRYSLLILSLFMFISCSHKVTTKGGSAKTDSGNQLVASPPCIIYKTKVNYSRNVPVILNEEKSYITSFPGVKDLNFQGKPAYPSELVQGFLLDNRGIGPNVAFLDYTYEEYQNLDKTPSADELMKKILDKDPLTEMYQCGTRSQYKDLENDLKKMILSGNLSACKKIK